MEARNLIVLTGFMGSGKSRIGQELADRLELPFFDLDKVIEKEEKLKIPDIFRTKGEEYFRMAERSCFRTMPGHGPAVLALGGGAIQQKEIRDLLKQQALTIFLDVPVETLFQRLKKDKKRPLLQDSQGKLLSDELLRKRISELLSKRKIHYLQADIRVPVQPHWSRQQTINELIRLLREYAPASLTTHN
ncbi:MAG: shikimate kinase [Balneolaceae bacterium]|nr:MAG: shikimate kinase [Balneolaceae bacterium]